MTLRPANLHYIQPCLVAAALLELHLELKRHDMALSVRVEAAPQLLP